MGISSTVIFPTYHLDTDPVRLLLPKMCATGRLYLQTRAGDPFEGAPVRWDPGEPWEFRLRLSGGGAAGRYRLKGLLRRDDQLMSLSQPEFPIKGGLLFAGGALSRYREFGSFAWITALRRKRHIPFEAEQLPALLRRILSLPYLPPLEIDEALGIRTLEATALPRLTTPWPGTADAAR